MCVNSVWEVNNASEFGHRERSWTNSSDCTGIPGPWRRRLVGSNEKVFSGALGGRGMLVDGGWLGGASSSVVTLVAVDMVMVVAALFCGLLDFNKVSASVFIVQGRGYRRDC